jgi:hypothetical protein
MTNKTGLTLLMLTLSGWTAHAATPNAAAAAAAGVGALVAEAGRNGQDARLSPNLTDVLGLGAHVGGLAVRQLAVHQGSEVRAFNVSAENSMDVVIYDYNESTRAMRVFLLTPAARLRRALTFTAGEAPHALAAPEARRSFAAELDYWLAMRRSAVPASR